MKKKAYLVILIFVFLAPPAASSAGEQFMTFVGNISGPGPSNFMDGIREVHVSGDYAYVVAVNDDAFNIVDVSDPSVPALVASVRDFQFPHFLSRPAAVDVVGNLAYVLSTKLGQAGITIFDISDPTNPTVVGHLPSVFFGNGNTIKVDGDFAYIVQGPNSWISAVNVSNPASPFRVSTLTLAAGAFPFDIDISGNHAFVPGFNNDTLYVINVSNPFSLQVVATISGADAPNFLDGAAGVKILGDYAFVAAAIDDSLTVIDVSDPEDPTFVGNVAGLGMPNFLDGARHLHVALNHAFVVAGDDLALTAVDISNPSAPVVVDSVQGAGTPNFLDTALDVFVSGNHAYVAAFGNTDRDNSLSIFTIGTVFLQGLIDSVETLVQTANLNKGEGNALLAKVEAAIKKTNQGQVEVALNQLQAFINQVTDLVNMANLSPAEGQALIDLANAIITQLGG